MENFKLNLKLWIKKIISNPIYVVFFILIIVLWGIISAEGIPSAPSNLALSINQTTSSLTIIWQDNSNNEENFVIQRQVSGGNWSATNYDTFTTTSNTYEDTSAAMTINYDYRVQACLVAVGCSDWSNVLTEIYRGIPASPSDLLINTANTTTSSIGIMWTDNATNENKFNVYRKLHEASDISANWSTITQITNADATNYVDTSVTTGVLYDYRVDACLSGYGCSDLSNTLSGVSVMSPIPSAPTNLLLNGDITSSSVNLTWTDNATTEDKYNIERAISGTTNFVSIYLGSANLTSYTDSSVTAGSSYDYKVQACLTNFGCSSSATLNNVIIPTTVTITVPNAPSNLSHGTATSSSVLITWTDNATNEDKFNVDRKLSTSTSSWSNLIQITTANTTSYNDTSVTAGSTYDYRVQACLSGTGCSSYTYLSGVLIPSYNSGGGGSTNYIPSAPTNLSLNNTVIPGHISLKWTDNADNENKFNIERRVSGTSTWSYLSQVGTNIIHYVDTTVTVGTTYDYRVQACLSGIGCSSYTSLSGVLVPTSTTNSLIPNAPSNLSHGTATSSSVLITWTDNATNEDKFNVDRKLSTSTSSWSNLIQITTANTTSYNDTSVTAGSTYDYRVQACLSGTGCSSYTYLSGVLVPPLGNINNPIVPPPVVIPPPVVPPANNPPVVPPSNSNNPPVTPPTNPTPMPPTTNGGGNTSTQTPELIKENVTNILNVISGPVIPSEQVIDLVYKDTNNDGISDYDSIYVYNLDPVKPSPTSNYEGKEINASEKILLGFDPSSPLLIKVEKDQPLESSASIVSSYKVNKVNLTEKKEIIINGQALPNSFITLYIYSTPIMVTIKTDDKGEWQYVLDKELENGEHTIYTATVNNAGNIVAKSSGYVFAKTAEAVTLKELPVAEASVGTEKPGLFEGKNLYVVISLLTILIIAVLVLAGVFSKKNN